MGYTITDGNKISFREITRTLAANTFEIVAGLCNFIELLNSTSDNVQISFNDGATYSNFKKGLKFKADPGEMFRDIRLLDTSGASNTLTVAYGQGNIDDARLVVVTSVNLPVDISAQSLANLTVQNSCLLGSTGISLATTVAADTSTDLIAAASNVAGVTVSHLTLFLDQLPGSYAYVKVGTRFVAGVVEGGFWTAAYPFRIAAGQALVLNYKGRVDCKGAY